MLNNKNLPNAGEVASKPKSVGHLVKFLMKDETLKIGEVTIKYKRSTANGHEFLVMAPKDLKIVTE